METTTMREPSSAKSPRPELSTEIAPRGYFTTSDGVKLAYRSGGNPKGPPVLFCYGLMCSSFHFKYQWEHLAPRYRLLTLDYRAHHISSSPKSITTLNFPRLAKDLSEFLDELGERRPAHLVGHSMGVNLALEFYEHFAARVGSLVLMAGAATFPARTRAERDRLSLVPAAMKIVDGLFPRLADELWRFQTSVPGADQIAGFVGFNTKLSKPEDIRRVVQVMSGFSPRIFAQLLGEYIRHDRRDTLARIRVPTLVISGDSDRAVPPHFQLALRDGISGSQFLSIEGGSHCPQFDRPDEVNKSVAEFFKSCTR